MSEKKYYPLTQSQRIVSFQLKYCPFSEIVNIGYVVEIGKELDVDLFIKSIKKYMETNLSTSVRLDKIDGNTVQYISEEKAENISFYDLSEMSEEEYDNSLREWTSKPFPNNHLNVQLYNVRLIRRDKDKYVLYGKFSHLIFDAYSIVAAITGILENYSALKAGEKVSEEKTSPLQLYEKESEYRKSKRYLKDRKFYEETVYKTEPQYTTINGKNAKEFIKGKKFGNYGFTPTMDGDIAIYQLSKELQNQVVEYASKEEVSPQAIYMTAVRSWLASKCEVTDVSITNIVSRRSTLLQKKAGGTMANSVILRTDVENNTPFREICHIIYNEQMELYRHGDFDGGEAVELGYRLFGTPKGKTYASFMFGYIPPSEYGLDFPVKIRRIPSGREATMVYMTVMPSDFQGNMCVTYSYQKGIVKEEKLKEFHRWLCRYIEEGIRHPEESLNNLIERI